MKIFKSDFRKKKFNELNSISDSLMELSGLFQNEIPVTSGILDDYLKKMNSIEVNIILHTLSLKDNVHENELDKIVGKRVIDLKDVFDKINVNKLSSEDKKFLVDNLNIGNKGDAGYTPLGYFSDDYKYACLLQLLKVIRKLNKTGNDNYYINQKIIVKLTDYSEEQFEDFYEIFSFVQSRYKNVSMVNNTSLVFECIELLNKFINSELKIIEEDDIKMPNLIVKFVGNVYSYISYNGDM